MLSYEDEQNLIKKSQSGDNDATMDLLNAYKPYLAKMVFKYRRSINSNSIDTKDMFQAAQMGFCKGIQRYKFGENENKNNRLATYAGLWAKEAIHNLLSNQNLVKIPAGSETTGIINKITSAMNFLKIEKSKTQLTEDDIENIAKHLNVRKLTVHDAINMSVVNTFSVDVLMGDSDSTYLDRFVDHDAPTEDDILENITLNSVMSEFHVHVNKLTPRNKDIVISHMNKMTLEELAKKYKLSRERVRQIYQKEYDKIVLKLQRKYKTTDESFKQAYR
ncbi:MAG: sigma-70 family RNA polymerase sigma factor [Candidimonas sp.]